MQTVEDGIRIEDAIARMARWCHAVAAGQFELHAGEATFEVTPP